MLFFCDFWQSKYWVDSAIQYAPACCVKFDQHFSLLHQELLTLEM